jgi:prepilin-type N-terminal cleavage/methylation domain-containing protein
MGFTLIELMIVIAIIAIVAAIAIPSILTATRAANERNASGSLKSMTNVQVAFKVSDSDGNAINDYWTTDIAGMYYTSTVSPATTPEQLIKMIELSVAQADGNTATGYSIPGGSNHISSPKAGHWFMQLTNFQSGAAAFIAYTVVPTDRFGLGAFPNSYASGKLAFIISESGTMYKRDAGTVDDYWNGGVRPAVGIQDTAGVLDNAYDSFPIDPSAVGNADVAGPWSKMD